MMNCKWLEQGQIAPAMARVNAIPTSQGSRRGEEENERSSGDPNPGTVGHTADGCGQTCRQNQRVVGCRGGKAAIADSAITASNAGKLGAAGRV